MYERKLAPLLAKSLKSYDVVTLLGARQTGKTTLVQEVFKQFQYISLEDPDIRSRAVEDARGFFSTLNDEVILDEIQRVPELTSYIQTIVDQKNNKRKFVLTGSNSSMLVSSVSQTLAGRTEVFELHSLSVEELGQSKKVNSLNDFLFNGGYPRIHSQDLDSTKWLKNYFQLYVEKDIRLIANITNLDIFERFVRLTAGRVGQLINASQLGNEVGVTSPTITNWISALKSTFICFSLNPHHQNFNKRIVKTPKLYFYDTGLLCYLLGITTCDQLDIHPLRGQIFENFIVSEFVKAKTNRAKEVNLFFWRDQKGHEIDVIEDLSTHLNPIEIKMSSTFNSSFVKNIEYFNQLQSENIGKNFKKVESILIYAGEEDMLFKQIKCENWKKHFENL